MFFLIHELESLTYSWFILYIITNWNLGQISNEKYNQTEIFVLFVQILLSEGGGWEIG